LDISHLDDYFQSKLEGHSVECIPPHRPCPLILTFQNLITSSPVGKGMTHEVWWQSDLNWCQKVVHKHNIYLHIYAGKNITSHHFRWGTNENVQHGHNMLKLQSERHFNSSALSQMLLNGRSVDMQ